MTESHTSALVFSVRVIFEDSDTVCLMIISAESLSRTDWYTPSKSMPTWSILLIKIMVGMFNFRRAWNRTRVWACTPSLAESTKMAPSKTARERYTSAKKSMWPGVSTMLTLQLCHWKEVTAVWMVIPRCRSKNIVSVLVVPFSTLPGSEMVPLAYSRRSVSVVLPASTWARIPILIMFMSILHTRPKRAQKSPAANTFTAGDHDFGYIKTHSANMSRYPSRYLIKRQKHS